MKEEVAKEIGKKMVITD